MKSLSRVLKTSVGARIVWGVSLAVLVALAAPLLALADNDRDGPNYQEAASSTAAMGAATFTPTPAPPTATPQSSPTPPPTQPPTATSRPPTATPQPPTATPDPFAGLVMVGHGAAAFYDPSYDRGGWDAIIRRHIQFGQIDGASFPYSPQGYYCVHPDYAIGNVLTLQNPLTGKTIRCTVADAVDPGDLAVWRSRWKIELSYAAFNGLGLNDNGNNVTVWAASG